MNNNFNNPNPWQNPFGQSRQGNFYAPAPRYELLKVRGAESVQNFRMAPNSETILVDETAPLVWHVQTDSSGYLTATPYTITLYQAQTQPQIDLNDLAERVKQLEDRYVQQSDVASAKSAKHKQRAQQSDDEGTK